MDFGPQQMGKWLIVVGVIIALLDVLMVLLGLTWAISIARRSGIRLEALARLCSDCQLYPPLDHFDPHPVAYQLLSALRYPSLAYLPGYELSL